ncbi:MAG: HAMP domain-containing sensor histidine kinase [Myxococcota bacterium]
MPAAAPVAEPRLEAGTLRLLSSLAAVHDCVLAIDPHEGCLFWADQLGLFTPALVCDHPLPVAQLLAHANEDARELLHEILHPSDPLGTDHDRRSQLAATLRGMHVEFRAISLEGAGTRGGAVELLLLDAMHSAGTEPGGRGDPVQPTPLEQLTKKNEELETCVRSVSHDLRSPLVSVLGFARLLRDDFGEPIGRTGLHFLDRIEQAGRNMERLLSDMLELSRIEDTPNCEVHVNPIAVLDQLGAELKISLDEAEVTLVVPSEVPILICDRTRLYQLFSNLIGNAIHHASAGGRIEVSVETVDDGWEISVADDGPGIAPEDRERIFEAFQTATPPPSTGRASQKKASGLGLAIVRKIVEAHHGRIYVESEVGEGARFVVWLPRETEMALAP